jgi:hypothetical protein
MSDIKKWIGWWNSGGAAPSTLLDGLLFSYNCTEGPANFVDNVAADELTYAGSGAASEIIPFKRGLGTLHSPTRTYVSGARAAPNSGGSFSIFGWFNIDSSRGFHPIVAQYGTSGSLMYRVMFVRTGTGPIYETSVLRLQYSSNGTTVTTLNSAVLTEEEAREKTIFFCFIHDADGDTVSLRVGDNYTLRAAVSAAFSANIYNGSTVPFRIGSDGQGNNSAIYSNDIAVVGRAITEDEILEAWNSGKGKKYPFNATPSANLNANQFSFYFLPGSKYVLTKPSIVKSVGWFITDFIDDFGCSFALSGGDNVHDGTAPEWVKAVELMQYIIDAGLFAGVQYGDRDADDQMTASSGSRQLTNYHSNFPQSFLSGQTDWSGGFYDSTLDSWYWLKTLGGVDYIIISTEAVASDAVMTWAAALCVTYSTRKVIYVNHQMVRDDGTFLDGEEDNSLVGVAYDIGDRNGGTDQYDTILKPYSNTIMSLSAHDDSSGGAGSVFEMAFNETVGDNSNKIVNYLNNKQHEDNDAGFVGWVVVIKVDNSANTIQFTTYNMQQYTKDWTTSASVDTTPARENVTKDFD